MIVLGQRHNILGECPTNIEDAILRIEECGRICYRSEDKIIEGSGRDFVGKIVKRGHFSVTEHSNMVIRIFVAGSISVKDATLRSMFKSPYLNISHGDKYSYVGGNFRAWMDELGIYDIDNLFDHQKNNIVTDLEEIPDELRRITVKFLTDRSVTHELVRHRPTSPSQESQRYCAYRQQLEVVMPHHYTKGVVSSECFEIWKESMKQAEKTYQHLLLNGESAEQARSVLPNCTATRIAVTASLPEWDNVIFPLRTSRAAYPPMRALMKPVMKEFKEKNWVL